MGNVIAAIGFVILVIGLVSLVKPLRRLGIANRKRALGVLLVGFVVLTIGANIAAPPGSRTSTAPASEVVATDDAERPSGTEANATAAPTPRSVEAGFGNGTHMVGADIQPGVYRSTGGSNCYWARLRGFGGTLEDVAANGNNAPEIVEVKSSDRAFETRGCGEWALVERGASTLATEIGDGTYAVGVHMAPGTYRSTNEGGNCYWARFTDFSHELDGVEANGNNPTVIRVSESDAGFTTFGCGRWSKIE